MDPCAIYVVNFQSIGVVFQIKKRKKNIRNRKSLNGTKAPFLAPSGFPNT